MPGEPWLLRDLAVVHLDLRRSEASINCRGFFATKNEEKTIPIQMCAKWNYCRYSSACFMLTVAFQSANSYLPGTHLQHNIKLFLFCLNKSSFLKIFLSTKNCSCTTQTLMNRFSSDILRIISLCEGEQTEEISGWFQGNIFKKAITN